MLGGVANAEEDGNSNDDREGEALVEAEYVADEVLVLEGETEAVSEADCVSDSDREDVALAAVADSLALEEEEQLTDGDKEPDADSLALILPLEE